MVAKHRDTPAQAVYPEPERYAQADLIARSSEIAGVRPEIARAALLGVEEQFLSVGEFRRACAAFFARRVT